MRDERQVADGLRILARIIARAYLRDKARARAELARKRADSARGEPSPAESSK